MIYHICLFLATTRVASVFCQQQLQLEFFLPVLSHLSANYSSSSSKEPPTSGSGDDNGDKPTSGETNGPKVTDGDKSSTTASADGAGGDKGGDKKGGGQQWWCPKCGDPCTHVDTFVCKYFSFYRFHISFFPLNHS